jgi:hypothetical protein
MARREREEVVVVGVVRERVEAQRALCIDVQFIGVGRGVIVFDAST